MKYTFLYMVCFLSVIVNGQDFLYRYTFHNKNGTVSLSITSDKIYELYSTWILDSEDDSHTIKYWGQGKAIFSKNKILCKDSVTYKKIYLMKLTEDKIKITSWNDYKNPMELGNLLSKWENGYNKMFLLGDFLINDNIFYISTIYKERRKDGQTVLLKKYSWESGSKKLVYESDQ